MLKARIALVEIICWEPNDPFPKFLYQAILGWRTSNYGGSISVGSNSKVTINFCSNGQFAFNGYSDLSAGGGAFDGQVSSNSKEGVGLWSLRLIKNYMVIRLVSNVGEVNYMPIERYTDDGAYYINGDKWVIGGSDICN